MGPNAAKPAAERWAEQERERVRQIVGDHLYGDFANLIESEPLTPVRVLILMANAWDVGRSSHC